MTLGGPFLAVKESDVYLVLACCCETNKAELSDSSVMVQWCSLVFPLVQCAPHTVNKTVSPYPETCASTPAVLGLSV